MRLLDTPIDNLSEKNLTNGEQNQKPDSLKQLSYSLIEFTNFAIDKLQLQFHMPFLATIENGLQIKQEVN